MTTIRTIATPKAPTPSGTEVERSRVERSRGREVERSRGREVDPPAHDQAYSNADPTVVNGLAQKTTTGVRAVGQAEVTGSKELDRRLATQDAVNDVFVQIMVSQEARPT
jgi:hypothetical protein